MGIVAAEVLNCLLAVLKPRALAGRAARPPRRRRDKALMWVAQKGEIPNVDRKKMPGGAKQAS